MWLKHNNDNIILCVRRTVVLYSGRGRPKRRETSSPQKKLLEFLEIIICFDNSQRGTDDKTNNLIYTQNSGNDKFIIKLHVTFYLTYHNKKLICLTRFLLWKYLYCKIRICIFQNLLHLLTTKNKTGTEYQTKTIKRDINTKLQIYHYKTVLYVFQKLYR